MIDNKIIQEIIESKKICREYVQCSLCPFYQKDCYNAIGDENLVDIIEELYEKNMEGGK